MKTFLMLLMVLFLFVGTAAADQVCKYTVQEVGLTRVHQLWLIRNGQTDLASNYEDNFEPEAIPIYMKRQTFNNIADGREFELLEGSFIYDYFVIVRFKTCEE